MAEGTPRSISVDPTDCRPALLRSRLDFRKSLDFNSLGASFVSGMPASQAGQALSKDRFNPP